MEKCETTLLSSQAVFIVRKLIPTATYSVNSNSQFNRKQIKHFEGKVEVSDGVNRRKDLLAKFHVLSTVSKNIKMAGT